MSAPEGIAAELKARAAQLGFARVGVAAAERLEPEAERLDAWLAAGFHGSMQYMERTAAVRVDPTDPGMLPEARSVIVLAALYGSGPAPAAGPTPGRLARYAQGRDYHNVLQRRLRKLTRWLRELGHRARAAVDSMPVWERAWAQRAGVGFIGKNCCLIVPGLGSHVFLSAVITSAELAPDRPMRERCGACRLCLDHCPTGAFVRERVLDARRCIAYLTIEHRGPIDPALRPKLGHWLFGCDACQDVCPYNRLPAVAAHADPAFVSQRWDGTSAESFLQMTEAEFARLAEGSPLKRSGREGMARNAALLLGNHGSRRHLPVLEQARRSDASPVVREAADWALRQLATSHCT